ncbi:MAG TPA: ribosome silencing factor [Terracidiphilus sp.]|jgi:ribosome-associated protein
MSTSPAQKQTRIMVQAAAAVCDEKKGQDTRILELDPVDSGLSDFFLVTSASNQRQAVAIADEIELRLKHNFGAYANSVEGRRNGEWILLDYVDFVIHVFLAEKRAFYDIERLRKSARPMTSSEFDGELTSALKEKTRAARTAAKEKLSPAVKSGPAARRAPAKSKPTSAKPRAAQAKSRTLTKARKNPPKKSVPKKTKSTRVRPAKRKR